MSDRYIHRLKRKISLLERENQEHMDIHAVHKEEKEELFDLLALRNKHLEELKTENQALRKELARYPNKLKEGS